MAALNYATQYLQALEQEFPYVLYFGALFATPNNGRYRWVNSRVIEIPTITTTGRIDGDRDTIGAKKRNFQNSWTPLTLETTERGRLSYIPGILTRQTRLLPSQILPGYSTMNRSSRR